MFRRTWNHDEPTLVRAVAETKPGSSHPYVSIIRFANCYSVTLSHDPTGYAGPPFDGGRLVATQTETLGRAAAVFNRLAASSEGEL